ncbi:hypothetical protein D3C71_1704590 [compost metagenome]
MTSTSLANPLCTSFVQASASLSGSIQGMDWPTNKHSASVPGSTSAGMGSTPLKCATCTKVSQAGWLNWPTNSSVSTA